MMITVRRVPVEGALFFWRRVGKSEALGGLCRKMMGYRSPPLAEGRDADRRGGEGWEHGENSLTVLSDLQSDSK